jgi:hypothetical protein
MFLGPYVVSKVVIFVKRYVGGISRGRRYFPNLWFSEWPKIASKVGPLLFFIAQRFPRSLA